MIVLNRQKRLFVGMTNKSTLQNNLYKSHTKQPTFSLPKATEQSLPASCTEMDSHRSDWFKYLYCFKKKKKKVSTPWVLHLHFTGVAFFLTNLFVHLGCSDVNPAIKSIHAYGQNGTSSLKLFQDSTALGTKLKLHFHTLRCLRKNKNLNYSFLTRSITGISAA